jgi:hypothetical protein
VLAVEEGPWCDRLTSPRPSGHLALPGLSGAASIPVPPGCNRRVTEFPIPSI